MAEEMAVHLEMQEAANRAAGMASEEARYAARRQFGGVAQVQERCREQRGWCWLDGLRGDLRLACRQIAKSPGFAAMAILIAALGIGAATSMFSVINTLVLRPVALPESERLAVVHETNLARGVLNNSCSYPNYADWRDRSRSWASLAALGWHALNLTGGSEPELVNVRPMTANLLPTLGLAPALGRGFTDAEDRPGHNHVAIISHAFWQRRLGGEPSVIGQTLTLEGASYTVVGVLPRGAFSPGELEVAIPLGAELIADHGVDKELEVYGRLKAGVPLEAADAELIAISAQIGAEHPDMDRGWSSQATPLAREIVGDGTRRALYVLLGAIGLLLLIAGSNLSNLLLVRASARTHELATRTALGAGRGRVIRQIVTESFVLTLLGGVLGVCVSFWAVAAMRSFPLPRASEITVDGSVLAASLVVTLLAGLLAGLGPALKAAQARPLMALKSRSAGSGRRGRFRDTMVVTQLALSLAMLAGAALLGRSFLRLVRVHPGFDVDGVLVVSLRPQNPENNGRTVAFYERVAERIAALPEVARVGLVNLVPLAEGDTNNPVFPVGPSVLPPGAAIQASWRLIDGGYFEAMQIPVLRGCTLAGLSPEEASRSVVLSASFARGLFGDVDPIGRQIDSLRIGGDRLNVVGVVGDVRGRWLSTGPAPTMYWSIRRFLYGPMHLVVRGGRNAVPSLPAIRTAIRDIDPSVPVFRVRTLEQLRADSLEQEQLILSLLSGFTGAALLLAALGTYGVMVFNVQRRTSEIGIRIAVGAQAGDVLRLILGDGMRLVALGILFGLGTAFAGARMLSTMLYETSTVDAPSYGVAALVLVAAAAIACWLPARRTLRIDPLVALRAD